MSAEVIYSKSISTVGVQTETRVVLFETCLKILVDENRYSTYFVYKISYFYWTIQWNKNIYVLITAFGQEIMWLHRSSSKNLRFSGCTVCDTVWNMATNRNDIITRYLTSEKYISTGKSKYPGAAFTKGLRLEPWLKSGLCRKFST